MDEKGQTKCANGDERKKEIKSFEISIFCYDILQEQLQKMDKSLFYVKTNLNKLSAIKNSPNENKIVNSENTLTIFFIIYDVKP